jgi:tetratricopeptide (TPR) repeat protein
MIRALPQIIRSGPIDHIEFSLVNAYGRLTSGRGMKTCGVVLALALTSACLLSRHDASVKYVNNANTLFTNGNYAKALELYDKAIKADSLNGEAYYRAGLAAIRLQNWERAAWYLQRAISIQPERLDSYSQLTNVYLFSYGVTQTAVHDAILKELEVLSGQLHKRFPNSYDDIRLRGYLALFAGQNEAALASFEQADRLKPHQQDLLLTSVRTLIALGQPQKAEALARDAINNNPDTAKMYDALIQHYLRVNRPDEAGRLLQLNIDRNPELPDAYLELAAYDFSRGRWTEMAAVLNQIAANTKRFPFGMLLCGDFSLRIRDFTHAKEYYQRGIDQGEKNRQLYTKRMVEVLYKQNNMPGAQLLVHEILRRDQKDLQGLAEDASLKVLSRDTQKMLSAISTFRSVMAAMPNDFVLRYLYGRALLLNGSALEAISQFEEAINLRPDYLWPKLALAHLMIDAGKYGNMLVILRDLVANEGLDVPYDTAGQRPQERPAYEPMLAVRPNSATALNDLVARVVETGYGVDESLVLIERARAQRPADDDIAATFALVLVKKNLPEKAIEILRPLVERQPSRAVYRYRLAMALLERGERAQAAQEGEAALRYAASTDEKTSIRRLLMSTR